MTPDNNSQPADLKGLSLAYTPLPCLPPPENGFEFIASEPFGAHHAHIHVTADTYDPTRHTVGLVGCQTGGASPFAPYLVSMLCNHS